MFDWIRWLVPNFKMPTWEDALLVIAIIMLGYIIQKYVLAPFIQWVGALFVKGKKPFIGRVIKEFEKAIRFAFFTAILFGAASILLEVSLFENEHTSDIFISLTILFIFIGIYDVLNYFGEHPNSFKMLKKDDEIIKPYIIRLMKVMTVILFVFTIASFWNFNLNGFLTGIGLTGVAVAFSVRETLTHIVSGMSIALDKPFQIGDWITTEDQKIEGIVKDINLRSTLIQTIDKGLIYVPNSYLVNKPIFNLENRAERKCEFYTFISNDNSEQAIRNVCILLHEQISLHPQVDRDLITVSVDEMYSTSFRLYTRFFVNTNDLAVLLQVRQDILFVLHDILKQQQVTLSNATEEVSLQKG